jgi:hypothetical protein
MRAPVFDIFKKKHPETAKLAPEHSTRSKAAMAPAPAVPDALFKAWPSWWMVLLAYSLAAGFCYLNHQFFLWFPPYLVEVFKNLKGVPLGWADIGVYWAEQGLKWIAILAAVYHNLWQVSTRYKLTSHGIHVESWFPFHRVTAAPYGSVRRVGYQQSLIGLALNYGHIEIDTGSPSGPLVLLNCPRPKKFMAILQPKVEAILQPQLSSHRRGSDNHPQ